MTVYDPVILLLGILSTNVHMSHQKAYTKTYIRTTHSSQNLETIKIFTKNVFRYNAAHFHHGIEHTNKNEIFFPTDNLTYIS